MRVVRQGSCIMPANLPIVFNNSPPNPFAVIDLTTPPPCVIDLTTPEPEDPPPDYTALPTVEEEEEEAAV